jgi:hypothetical protein
MVLENPVPPFVQWFIGDLSRLSAWGAGPIFVATLLTLALLAVAIGLLVSIVMYGPAKGGERVYAVVRNGLGEMFYWSPRRVGAVARLAVQEALRKRVLVAIIVFIILLLFARWFLQSEDDPAKIYFSFVLTATAYLGVFIGLLLSVFSLPDDFKSKTIYTIVTKPVRAGDIVLGRIIGFSLVGTALLLLMGTASYVFVWRSLDHTHQLDTTEMQEVRDANGEVLATIPRYTTSDNGHRHEIVVGDDGGLIATFAQGHEHQVLGDLDDLSISAPLSTMRARVPLYGEITFRDPNGNQVARGVSVGKEWKYRSFIQGGTQAAAIWKFENVDESLLVPDKRGTTKLLPIELIVRVFRTYKADIVTPIQGSIQLRNPVTQLKSRIEFFSARDAQIDSHYYPLNLTDADNNPIELFGDLVTKDGSVEVIVQCVDRAQYFGFAMADCFVRRPDASPLVNFAKAIISIWVQMVIVISLAVAASALLSGPIALLLTSSLVLLGYYKDYFLDIARGDADGGGPIEALVRLVTHMNLTSPFPNEQDRIEVQIMKGVDKVIGFAMERVAGILPDFTQFNGSSYVASGFDIPWMLVVQQLLTCLAFVVGAAVIGYFFLRNREVAR